MISLHLPPLLRLDVHELLTTHPKVVEMILYNASCIVLLDGSNHILPHKRCSTFAWLVLPTRCNTQPTHDNDWRFALSGGTLKYNKLLKSKMIGCKFHTNLRDASFELWILFTIQHPKFFPVTVFIVIIHVTCYFVEITQISNDFNAPN